MKRVRLALAGLLCAAQAGAHRIDETLQASLLTVEPRRVAVALRLVPGAQVAKAVIAAIDRDRDGVFSASEQRTYAQRLLQDQSISVDGLAVAPTLLAWRFPAPAQMREGTGEVQVDYSVALPRGDGARTVELANQHREGASVFLANATVPQDAGIAIVAQRRNAQQSVYALDFRQGANAGPDRATRAVDAGIQALQLLAVAAALLPSLWLVMRRRLPPLFARLFARLSRRGRPAPPP